MSTWLETRRKAAAESSEALGVPSLSDEHWRFTSLRGIDFDRYAVSAEATAGDMAGAILGEGDHAGRLVMRDGGVVAEELLADVAAQGVVFGSLARLADEHAALIEPILGTIVGYDERFAAENGALWTDGLLLHVPAGVKVQLPFHTAYEIATPESAQQWRVIVSLGEGAEATLVEEHLPGQPGYANGVAELVLAETSHLTYVVVQDPHGDAPDR